MNCNDCKRFEEKYNFCYRSGETVNPDMICPYIINDLCIIDLKPDEVVALGININEISLEQSQDLFEDLSKRFPTNSIFLYPKSCSLDVGDKKWALEFIDQLRKAVEEFPE